MFLTMNMNFSSCQNISPAARIPLSTAGHNWIFPRKNLNDKADGQPIFSVATAAEMGSFSNLTKDLIF